MLTPQQKAELKRVIDQQNAILADNPPFKIKRAAQKIKLEALMQLGAIPKKSVIN